MGYLVRLFHVMHVCPIFWTGEVFVLDYVTNIFVVFFFLILYFKLVSCYYFCRFLFFNSILQTRLLLLYIVFLISYLQYLEYLVFDNMIFHSPERPHKNSMITLVCLSLWRKSGQMKFYEILYSFSSRCTLT